MENMKIDESKDIYVKFPDDYRDKKIAGKNAKFLIKVKDIQKKLKS